MTRNTVFVVGAGASAEYDLPIGREFRHDIEKATKISTDQFGRHSSGNRQLSDALTQIVFNKEFIEDIRRFVPAADHISSAVVQAASIDNFIDAHRAVPYVELIGKMAIAQCILAAESSSKLQFIDEDYRQSFSIGLTENTWLHKLFEMLVTDVDLDGFKKRLSSTAVIVFNYDRCVEHYLFHATKNYYRITEVEVADALDNLSIIHPYGQVGELPGPGVAEGVHYGSALTPHDLHSLSKGIRTFTEQMEDQSIVDRLGTITANARTLLFLGFAYHKQNVEILRPKSNKLVRKIYGSAFGMSEPNHEIAKSLVESTFLKSPRNLSQIKPLTAYDLLDQYSTELAF